MPRLRSAIAVVLCLCVAGAFAPAALRADTPAMPNRDDEAQEVFLAGRSAFDAGDFERALRDFERAYVLSHRPELLFNVATALDRLRRDEAAAHYFSLYLEALPDAENRAAVEARIAHLRRPGAPASRAAPSPEQAARAATLGADQASARADAAPLDDSARRKRVWWWTVAGVVLAAGAATAVALAVRSPEREREAPILGSQGAYVQALWGR